MTTRGATGHYWSITDNIRQCLIILENIWKVLAISIIIQPLRWKRELKKPPERYWAMLDNIWQYCTVSHNIAHYCTIFHNIWQYLKLSYNIVVYLAIYQVIYYHRSKCMLFQTFPFHFYLFFFSHGRVLEELSLLKIQD